MNGVENLAKNITINKKGVKKRVRPEWHEVKPV